MPFGDFPFGDGPFGFDPVAPPSVPGPKQKGAPLIHPGTGDVVQEPDGTLLGVHPVDQAVNLALRIAFGTVGSASTLGNTLRQVTHAGPDLVAQVRQRVERALNGFVSRGDIALLRVVPERIAGGFTCLVEYRNLRTSETRKRTVTGTL